MVAQMLKYVNTNRNHHNSVNFSRFVAKRANESPLFSPMSSIAFQKHGMREPLGITCDVFVALSSSITAPACSSFPIHVPTTQPKG